MSNKIEVVDGVKGEWRTVTRAEEVKVGQRVRYECFGKRGYEDDDPRLVKYSDGHDVDTWDGAGLLSYCINLFDVANNIQAFFPVAEKKPRKVAKVDVGYYFSDGHFSDGWQWYLASSKMVEIHSARNYTTRAHAIRGARRFCKSIGYECKIV